MCVKDLKILDLVRARMCGVGYRISLEGILWDVTRIGLGGGFRSEGALILQELENLFFWMIGVVVVDVYPGTFLCEP